MSDKIKSLANFDADSSRRQFFQTTAVAATTASLIAAPNVHAAGTDTIRVGLVGCGGRGRGAAINAMDADPDVRIVALGDLYDSVIENCRKSVGRNRGQQFDVADDHCFAGVDAYKHVIESDIDVVLLASPPHFRPDHFEAAVAAGKQIFCEKPVATDPVGVRRIEAACKIAEGKKLNVVSGLCWRYDEGMQEVMARVKDGQIGEIINSQANYLTSPLWMKTQEPGESDIEYQMRNWINYIWLSGDHIVEQFIHSLDKAMWLHDDVPPVQAYGMGGRELRVEKLQGNIYDHFSVVYEWADGSRCFANTRQMSNCFNQTEDFVFGSDGIAEMCNHKINGKKPWHFNRDSVQMHQAEQNEFFKAIRGQRDRINNGDYMCKSTMMAILGREACYTGDVLTYDMISKCNLNLGPSSYEPGPGPEVFVPQPDKYEIT